MKFKVRPVINKSNGQINISLPKKKFKKSEIKKIIEKKEFKILLKI